MNEFSHLPEFDRFMSERDFPIYDASADESLVPNEDWEAYFADNYSDPMEWVA